MLVVPGRPGTTTARQQAGIGMQHRAVTVIANSAQDLAFLQTDIVEQARSNAMIMIRAMYRMANYDIEVEWIDEETKNVDTAS